MGKYTKQDSYKFGASNESKIQSDQMDRVGVFQGGPVYTVEEAVNAVGYGKFQIKVTFLCGFVWMADAFEIIILSLLGPMLACDWHITRWQNALMTSIVFVSMTIGCLVFGVWADQFGRRTSLAASSVFLCVFGAVGAASPSYPWMLVFRAFTGFALGGLAQALTLCCEYFPTRKRGRAGFYLCYFWAIGTIGIILVAWGVTKLGYNWRILIALAAVPALVAMLMIRSFPESARFLLVSGQRSEAFAVLRKMSKANHRSLPDGLLLDIPECTKRGRISHLLSPVYRRSTLLLWYMWAALAFSYYGMTLTSPLIIMSEDVQSISEANVTFGDFISDFHSLVPCVTMTDRNYIDLLWTSAAELPGLIVFTVLVEFCDRKKLMCISCFLSGTFIFVLLIKTTIKIITLTFLFAARALLLAQFQMLMIMTSEAFPTTLRAIAMGTGTGWCRLGALISPYIAQVLVVSSPISAICVFGGALLLAGLAAAFLTWETRGMELLETHCME